MKKYLLLFFCIMLVADFPFCTKAQTISTIAGTGTGGYSTDGIAATGAELNSPFGIAFTSGSLYIADRLNNRVRKVDNTGIITTIAGNGTSGFTGDGGPATVAELGDAVDVAADSYGNVYIADKANNRIRKVDTAGYITTIAGTATYGYSGDNGPATLAELSNPRGVAVDSRGNVYISDQGNNRVRKVDTNGIITTFAGTTAVGYNGDGIAATTAQLRGPYGIATDAAGNVYVSDVDNARIRKIDTFGMITTIAGNGTGGYNGDDIAATAAELYEPIAVAADGSGNIYIADGWNSRIRGVTGSGVIYTIAGNGIEGYSGDGGLAVAAELNAPFGVAVDGSGNIYIADYNNNRVRFMSRPTGVNNITPNLSSGLQIYPNPSSGTFTVNIHSGIDEQAQIVISNLLGEKTKEIRVATNNASDIQLEVPGVYFLNAVTTHEIWSGKVIVQ